MKSEFARFIRQVGLVLLGTWVLAAYPLYVYGNSSIVRAAVVGCALCTINVLAGCLSAVWAVEKSQQVFLKTLFGGLTVRLLGLGLIFFLLIKFTSVHVVGLTLSLFVFYVVFQVLEIRFLITRLASGQAPKEGV
ncbi:MAG: hypothetical protein O2954_04760 [bacterium]|nr:hypothetical protein [bacterium]